MWVVGVTIGGRGQAQEAQEASVLGGLADWRSRTPELALHDTVLKRYRVAAGSARTIHDYLRPPRLPSLPRFFHPSRLFSLRDPSYTHDSAIEIATGIAPHDSAMEIATGIAPASSRTRRPKLHSPPLNFPLIRHSTLTSTSQITSQNFGREDADTRLSRTLSSMYIHLSYYYLISRKVSYNMSVQVNGPPTMDI